MPIINLTKLTIRLAGEDGEVYQTFDPADEAVEIHTRGREVEVDGVPIEITHVTGVDGLPDPEEGTYYIVPQPVAYTVDRPDLVIPDTGPSAIREDDGKVYAVHRLYSVSKAS